MSGEETAPRGTGGGVGGGCVEGEGEIRVRSIDASDSGEDSIPASHLGAIDPSRF